MNVFELQDHLRLMGFYSALSDGLFGPRTEAGVMKALTRVDEAPLDAAAYAASGKRLGVEPAIIRAFATVESGGRSGFLGGRPVILPEPHVFSRLTGHGYDRTHPQISYPIWGTRPYPTSQGDRYAMLLHMVALAPDAGFSSVSYGSYQIMGMNHRVCGYDSPFEFAHAMAHGEEAQLQAFEAFVKARGMVRYMKAKDWRELARLYNGSGQKDLYAGKLAEAYDRIAGL